MQRGTQKVCHSRATPPPPDKPGAVLWSHPERDLRPWETVRFQENQML